MKNPIEKIELEERDLSKIALVILSLSSLVTDYSFFIIVPVVTLIMLDIILNNLNEYKKQLRK